MEKTYDAIIVGGGPAGLSAAIYMARARFHVLVIEKEKMGGQITITSEVVNYPGILKTTGEALTSIMVRQAQNFGAQFLTADVTGLDLEGDFKTVHTSRGDFKTLGIVYAGGAHPRLAGFTGEEEYKGHGVAYCATCDGAFFRNKVTAVIGGGDVAVEDAIFLARMCSKVYLIHRRNELRAAKSLQENLLSLDNVEVIWDTVADSINGDGMVKSLSLTNVKNGQKRELDVQGVFIAVGITPESRAFEGLVDMDHGYIRAGEDTVTSAPGIFAAGDVRTKPLRQIITAAADGANAITSVERYLVEN